MLNAPKMNELILSWYLPERIVDLVHSLVITEENGAEHWICNHLPLSEVFLENLQNQWLELYCYLIMRVITFDWHFDTCSKAGPHTIQCGAEELSGVLGPYSDHTTVAVHSGVANLYPSYFCGWVGISHLTFYCQLCIWICVLEICHIWFYDNCWEICNKIVQGVTVDMALVGSLVF